MLQTFTQGQSYLVSVSENAFPYSQPPLTELLVLLSFLYLLNVVRVGADYFLHAGVVAMIALGTIYGTPLAAIHRAHDYTQQDSSSRTRSTLQRSTLPPIANHDPQQCSVLCGRV